MIITLITAAVIIAITAVFLPEKKQPQSTSYNASFLDENDVVSTSHHGYCVNGRKCLTIDDSFKHVLVTGGSGNFKTSGILIPSILRMKKYWNFIINDPSGELLLKSSGALLQAGYEIKVLNYNNPIEGYNPLMRVTGISSIKKISKLLVTSALGNGGKDPFWNASAEQLITICIQAVMEQLPKEYQTLANVFVLLSLIISSPEKADKFFVKTSPAILNEYKAFVGYGSKTLSSVVATARTALSNFGQDENVALLTSHDSISFADFRTKRIALFINNSVTTMRYHSALSSIFLDQFFEEIMGRPCDKKAYPIAFLLDEASSLYFNNLQITIANIRKYSCSILQVYQSASQLVDLYGVPVSKAISENSYTKIYMPGVALNVAMELETLMGKMEYTDDKSARHVRSLLTANEIHELEQLLIFIGNKKAIKTDVIPYFKQYWLRHLSNLPPYRPVSKIPFGTPPLMQF